MSVSILSKFAEHIDAPYMYRTSGWCFPGDEMRFQSVVSFDFSTGSSPYKLSITQARMRIVASKASASSFDESFDASFVGGRSFVLDEFLYSFSGDPRNAFGLPNPNFTADRVFQLPSGDFFRQTKIWQSGIGANEYYLTFEWPILFRWEYWKALATADDEFINYAEPQNGKNHWWYHYQTGDWTIGYVFEIDVFDASAGIGGATTTYRSTRVLEAKDYNSNGKWVNEKIELFDGTTALPNGYLLGYTDTKVVATFECTDSGISIGNVYGVLWIETYEGNGVAERTRISSLYDVNAESWWKSSDGSNRLKVTNIGSNVFELEALIDYTKLPLTANRYTIYARLYNEQEMGEEIKEDNIILIRTDEKPGEKPSGMAPTIDCPFALKVLADAGSSDPIKNDKSSILKWAGASVENITFTLQKRECGGSWTDATALYDDTFGTMYEYGFRTDIYEKTYAGYLLNWKMVLATYGEGNYRIQTTYHLLMGGTSTEVTEEYCLQQYYDHRADGTIRIEATMKGVNGDVLTPSLYIDYGSAWYQQIRLQGRMYYTKSTYTKETNQYGDGQFNAFRYVVNEQTPKFTVELKPIPGWLDFYLSTNVLQSDVLLLTDYNRKNRHALVSIPVMNDGEYLPKNNDYASKYSAVTLEFSYAQNQLRSRNL